MSTTPADLDAARIVQKFPDFAHRYDWSTASEIGAGGFGAVWKVHDTWLSQDVAIKISNQSLVDEMRLCREIDGQTVRIYDYLRGTGPWNAFSMELLGGHWMTLQAYIGRHRYKKKDLQHYFDCFEIARDVLVGLCDIHGPAYARTKRFVHADIKPQNIFVGISPKKTKTSAFRLSRHRSVVKVIDLGVAVDQGLYPAGFTPSYAYPKAGVARSGHALYSVAIMFLQILTKNLPDHGVMRHKKRITSAVVQSSSGSDFVDKIAVEFIRLCARAATQSTTAKSLLQHLDRVLFSLDAPYLIALRSISRQAQTGLRKTGLADLIFSDMAAHYGWNNKSDKRLAVLADLILDMYARGMLKRSGHLYSIK